MVVVSALALTVGIAAATPAAATVPTSTAITGITVSATGGNVLAGGTRTVSVSGSNPDGVDLFNALGVVMLPVGATYAPGSVSPANLGEPTIQTWIPDANSPDPANPATAQVLVWSNAADLPVGSVFEASFGVTADPNRYPAGSTFDVGAGLYANSDERVVPDVTIPASGAPNITDATEGGSADAKVTVVPITISKSETENAESEVYRGPANPATFELTVAAAPDAGTDGVVVVDDVPAQFTVTACQGTIICTRQTVEVGGKAFTRITWNLGNVAQGTTTTLRYTAYVADQEITYPAGAQSGPSTRPGAAGYDVTNTATLSGTYTGDVASGTGTAVTVSDKATVRVLDLGIVKTSAGDDFVGGSTMAYTLHIRSSQFITSTGIVVEDVIPNGMCPVLPADVTRTGDAWPQECIDTGADAGTGTVTGATMRSVAFDSVSGQFTVLFDVADLAADQDATIGYSVYMRKTYQDGRPTAVGDGFTNSVTVDGTTHGASGPSDANNGSTATLGTASVTLSKTLWRNAARTPITGVSGAGNTCASGTYSDPSTASPAYQLGDLVCFRIDAQFPNGVSTRSVNLSDYLPAGMTFVDWTAAADSTTTVTPVGSIVGATGRWVLGQAGAGGVYFVAPGAHASLYILARVDTVPATTARVTGNLAKLRYTTEGSRVVNLRDQADLRLSPPPPLTLDKKVNGADALTPVQEGQSLGFTIDVNHIGTVADSTADPIDMIEVWDVLPVGFDCDDITSATPPIDKITACVNNADGTTSVKWVLDLTAAPLVGGQKTTIAYTLVAPSPLSISSTHTNTAAVTRYTPITTDGIIPPSQRATFYPTNPVGAYPDKTKNASQASDTATIGLAGASVTKAVASTSVTESNNSALTQATIGETVVWRYSATIPAKTSVFNGVLVDGLPVGGRLTAVDGAAIATGPAGAVIADGCAQDATQFRLCDIATDANFGSLIFPTTWTNATAQPQTFTVEMTTRVADVAGNTHNSAITNTATLTSTPSTTNSGSVSRGSANAQVTVVVPNVALAKGASTTANGPWTTNNSLTATGGQTVYYRLNATNTTVNGLAVPPLHDTVIVDCIDSRLGTFTNLTSSAVATLSGPVAGDGLNGCAFNRVKYTWTLAAALASTAQIVYSVTVPNPVGAGSPFQNDATLTGSTLVGAVPGERALTATSSQRVTAAPPTLTKVRTAPAAGGTAVPGETVSWRVTVTVPSGETLYGAQIRDTLPPELGAASGASYSLSCGGTWDICPTATRTDSGQVLIIGVGDIPASTSARTLILDITSTVSTTIAATAVGPYTNTAVVQWSATSGGAAITSTPATATVDIRHPLVTTSKSVSNPTVSKAQGEIFTYTVSAAASQNTTNGKTAYNVKVVDQVPAGVVPVVSSTDATPLANGATVAGGGVWNATARTITWTIASLTPGAAATTFTYPAKLALASTLAGGALQNTATPTSWTSLETASAGKAYGPGAGAKASVTPAFPKVNATKTQLSPNPVYIGDEVSYSFTLTNAGNASAISLSAVDTLPTGWSYVAGSARLGGAALADPSISGQRLTWANLGPLAPAANLTITYRAVAGASVSVGNSVAHTNTVTAASVTDATGGTSYNGGAGSYIGTSGSAIARIDLADMGITKSAGTFTAGGAGTFTLTVKNNGPDAAVGVAISEDLDLPAGVTFTSATGAGWSCGAVDVDGKFSCTRTDTAATVASGATLPVITVTVAVASDVASGTRVPNTAVVSSNTTDRTTANNTATATGTVATSADLAVAKRVVTPATGAVTAGEPIEWSITLRNLGPSVSRGSAESPIVLADILPANVTGVTLTGTVPDGCTLTGGVLRCEIAHGLAVGESVVVSVAGTVRSNVPAGTAVVSNTAVVTPITTDPVTTNNSSTTATDVAVRESLTIVKSILDPAPPQDVVPGQAITYAVQVHNGGPSDARGVYVVDTLPADIAYTTLVSGAGWTATPSGNTVRFTYSGVLAAGADAPLLTYRATLDPGFVGDADELQNTASVSSAWKADQDSSSATPGVPNPEADLALTKSVRPTAGAVGDAVVAGETAVYTLTVDNLGPSDADAVTVTDSLPLGMSVAGSLPSACSVNDRVITCVLPGGLDEDDAPWTFDITVRVDASFTGTQLRNAAVVRSETDDPNLVNNAAAADLAVIQRAHLRVTKTPAADTVTAGTNVTWTITVANDGPSDAQNVSLNDVLDSGLMIVSATSETDGVTCSGSATVSCTIGTLAAGADVDLAVVTTVRSSVAAGTSIPNVATAVSTTIDGATGSPATATDDARIDVVATAELTIDKTTTTPTVSAGNTATFQIAVGNAGPSDAAASVIVTDTLPAGLTYVSSSTIGGATSWSCDTADGQQIACVLQDADGDAVSLAAGADAPVLQVVAAVAANQPAGDVTNTATVTSPSDLTPPVDTADVTVVTFADLGITKTNIGTPTAGEEFAWTITVTNGGPSDSVATPQNPILVTDPLPVGVSFVSAEGGGADCAESPVAGRSTVTCAISDTLAPGDAVTVTLRVAVAEDVSGTITNTAIVAPGLTPEPAGAVLPNEASNTTPTVVEVADLAIEKTVTTNDADIVAGQQISWDLTVTNLGPSNSDADAAHPIVVTDTLPAGVLADAATGPSADWSCTIADDRTTVSCDLSADLATSDPQVITVTGTVAPDTRGAIVNRASAAPGLTAEPDTEEAAANDHASVNSLVLESADLRLLKDVLSDVVAGSTGRYLLQVFNDGPSTARNVTITDTLPDVLTFERVVPVDGETTSPWTCAPSDDDVQLIECAYDGTIAPGPGAVQLVIEVSAGSDLTGDVVNTATVASTTPDPDLDNNTASVSGTVAEIADLSIVKTAVGDPVVGGTFAYDLVVSNAGPTTARDVVVEDTLPDGLELVGVSGDAWTCDADAATGAVSCTLDELAPGVTAATITIEVRVRPAAYPEVSNTATVSSTTPEDPATESDNASTAAVVVPPLSTLQITKELTDELVTGSQAHYVITVTNTGPTVDPGPITISDPMPTGLVARAVVLDGADGTCDVSATTITCVIDELAVAQTVTLTLTVDVLATARGDIVNTAATRSDASGAPVNASAAGTVKVVALPHTGGSLGLYLPFGLVLLALGLAALWWARRRRVSAQ